MHFVTASTCRPDSQTQLTVRWVFFFAIEWDGLADGLTRWIIRLSSFGSGLPNLGMYEAWHAGSTAWNLESVGDNDSAAAVCRCLFLDCFGIKSV